MTLNNKENNTEALQKCLSPLNDLNAEQRKAAEEVFDHDVVVSAGAGSGKTYTLSQKIFYMITNKDFKPSELLVLTFTDNAAHEMKERILKKFKENADEYFDEMSSAHIQTFDSFASYLVKTHSSELGISSSFSIGDESLIENKKYEILDQILDEYYSDKIKKDRICKTLIKFNLSDDKETKKDILYLYNKLSNFLPEKKNKILNEFLDDKFSKVHYENLLNEVLDDLKEDFKIALFKADFVYKNSHGDKRIDLSDDPIFAFFNDEKNISYFENLNENEFLQYTISDDKSSISKFAKDMFEILNCNDYSLCLEKYLDLLVKVDLTENFYNGRKEPKYNIIKNILRSVIYKYSFLKEENDYDRYLSFKEDFELYFEIIKELDKRLNEFKLTNNFYTFTDISHFALRLLCDKNYEKVAKEIRNQFKFIMVDEYQDTNDIQEKVLDSLTRLKEDNTRAHIFCVGDAKQSIYLFRNSIVKLFNDRIEKYENLNDIEHQVIYMSTNYRSSAEVISDINYIFKKYMTKDHGDINYLKENEQLKVPTKDLNKLTDDKLAEYEKNTQYAKSNFGAFRITYNACGELNELSTIEKECLAIIKDIKDKVNNKFKVIIKGKVKEVQYSDFLILTRKKTKFSVFQDYFNKYGIPLEVKFDTDLKSITPIMTLITLLSLVDYYSGNKINYSITHLFASLSRSYLYFNTCIGEENSIKIDDEFIYNTIKNDKIDDVIYIKQIQEFVKNNSDLPLSDLFINLIKEFKVVDKLYLLDDVNDNIAKIESLYNKVVNQETIGNTLRDFIDYLSKLDYYDIKLKDTSVFSNDNAVRLMTIHASKGLEAPIVYIPNSCMKKASEISFNKPNIIFDEKYGILFNDNFVDTSNSDGSLKQDIYCANKKMPYYAYINSLEKNNDLERDEHVRIIYVALTRAENCLYFVGNSSTSLDLSIGGKDEDASDFFSYFDKNFKINESYLKCLENDKNAYNKIILGQEIEEGNKKTKKAKGDEIKTLPDLIQILNNYSKFIHELTFSSNSFDTNKYPKAIKYYRELKEKYLNNMYRDKANKKISDYLKSKVYCYYVNKYNSEIELLNDDDKLICFARLVTKKENITSFEDYKNYINNLLRNKSIDNKQDDDNIDENIENCDNLEDLVIESDDEIKKDLLNKAYEILNFNNDSIDKLNNYLSFLLYYYYKKELTVIDVDYKTNEYEDKNYALQLTDIANTTQNLDLSRFQNILVDDTKTEFKERIHLRASSIETTTDTDNNKLQKGTNLHRYLELVNFDNRDTSLISNTNDRRIIDNILNSELLKDLKEKDIRKEFTYYDEDYNTYGSIDLLIIKDGIYTIVDYKTSNIDKGEYISQLHTYQRNVEKIFSTDKNHIKLYLLSLTKNKIKEIEPE